MKIVNRVVGNYQGEPVREYTLSNETGMTVSCLDYGCVITKILVPDRHGNVENVVLGFDEFEDYLDLSPYFGAVVGRVAGRIKDARFELNGKEYQLAKNNDPNHLHGGNKGFDSVVWKADVIEEDEAVGVKFHYLSPDGEEGYPGNLNTNVTYLLNNKNELTITYKGKTDQQTIINLTNHSYFNLSGNLKSDCSNHILQVNSDRFLELGQDLIPTGKILYAKNTPFDFQHGRRLLSGINSEHPQNVLVGNGYDHPLIFTAKDGQRIVLSDEESGRTLIVTTDQPCVVLYTSNNLEGPFTISGVKAKNYLGVCLETQGFPDAVNHSDFPSVVLHPEEEYYSKTTYRFFSKIIGD
ncbi:aldose epimerase family protein [Bacillus sp. USDA818B3_A]|uniref:aldose epimerase family protein n=1 Tax=Bacillus sp. USDA818B3_A TaxID=2698834 RepID=UPI00136AFF15|nr:aldose epimerase family protein [Bacillus sp. USDA818B3_A]